MRPPGRPYLLPAPVHPNKRPDQRLHIPQRSRLPAAIDPDFNVLQTNYRSATGTAPKAVPPKVGNLLRCRNGEDAGVCGTHELCADCPVRAPSPGCSGRRKASRDWRSRWCLHLRRPHGDRRLHVSVAGNFLTVAGQPRVVLTVSDISAQKRTQREWRKPAFAPRSRTA